MPIKAMAYSSLDFVKKHNESYFQLLRLARVSEGVDSDVIDRKKAITILNQLPFFHEEHKQKVHKRLIPLLNDKAHKLAIFNALSAESQKILMLGTQQGIVTELASKKQLNNIIAALSEDNIPLILLKGAAFAEVLYSPQAPRPSNDLDILIQKQHWHKAVALIKTLMKYTEKAQADVFGDLYELSFIPKGKIGAAVDLHASLINPLLFNIDEVQLWQESVEHPSFNNQLVRMLSPEHALIHQALHAYKDMDFCKYNLVDSHEIINAQQADIKQTIVIAKQWGVSTALFVLLKNCTEIMGTNLDNKSKSKNKNNSERNGDLLQQIKPNLIMYKIMVKLLKSRFTQPIGNTKPLRYRVNQIIAQFVFSGSVLRPLALQWLYVKSALKKRLSND
ncbi:nucleotidyltransferase family protein [Colwellia sp. TT2012]|uniref:nucleotidyltransferase family protein n=1 Tax=Colwellia sp. TT2012 TaxID=1720342 RepID=UPI0007106D45|nr:nucleotidyltransferase family protein [Colwellia sp. TT2012]